MGDRGGAKNKGKLQKQKASKQAQMAQQMKDKQKKSTP
jgi:hypothetical protein